MAYTWDGMKKISFLKARRLHKKGKLVGCYRLYPEFNMEALIGENYSWAEIVAHHKAGGEFGYEKVA